jgi:hypothetical protein
MDAATRTFVRERVGNVREYCLLPQAATPFATFHVEHVIAKQLEGLTPTGRATVHVLAMNEPDWVELRTDFEV